MYIILNDSFILESGDYHKDKPDKGFTFPFCVVNYVLSVLVEIITCLIKAASLDCGGNNEPNYNIFCCFD